ncbi:hypothetical protein H2203_004582 [Taxawa tesnikishii (nom. ined.)]|nr:hypothetical protein H2203_004582 [Dothideales sp. JES 119]
MASKTKVLLFGAGAVGTIYVYLLQRAGCDVTAVCRSNYDAARANGFHIDSKKYGNGIHIQPRVVQTPQEAERDDFDYVIVSAKAFPGNEPSTASLLRPVVGKTTAIVLIQNGIGIEEEYRQMYPQNCILSCVVYLPTTQTSPGHVNMGDIEWLEIGTYPASSDKSERQQADVLKDLLIAGGGTAEVFDDIQPKRWSKLLVNAPWNPICALTRCRDVAFMASSPVAKQYVKDVMMEVVHVAQAVGYAEINEEMAEMQLGRATARIGTKGVEPSMMADALNGRRMEVEAIVGNVVRMGQEKGLAVPKLEGLYVLLKALDASMAAARGEP